MTELTAFDVSKVKRALVVVAHPDDIDFGCAGTVAQWTAAGVEVSYCLVSDGNAGGYDRSVSRTDMATLRQAEQTEAAKRVGVTDLHFLGHQDGAIYVTHELRRDISRVIRLTRPDVVVTQSPDRNLDHIYTSHPDHMAAGEATMCAVYPDARNPFAHPELLDEEGLEPHAAPQVLLMSHPGADFYVDITTSIDDKIEALRCHESQTAHMTELDQMMRTWASDNAKRAGMPEGVLLETFRRVNTE